MKEFIENLNWLGWIISIIVILLLGVIIYAGYKEAISPTIELNREEWQCTNKRLETRYIMLNGKLHPTILNKCIEYQRK